MTSPPEATGGRGGRAAAAAANSSTAGSTSRTIRGRHATPAEAGRRCGTGTLSTSGPSALNSILNCSCSSHALSSAARGTPPPAQLLAPAMPASPSVAPTRPGTCWERVIGSTQQCHAAIVVFSAALVARSSQQPGSYGGRSGGAIWYFDIPSPNTSNTTLFSVLWPPSIALWGSLVPPYIPWWCD
jgi:hypothetical protein